MKGSPDGPTVLPGVPSRGQQVAFWLFFLAGLAWSVSLMKRSTGAALDDEIAHFLVARDVWNNGALILDLWGRTVNTLIYTLPAALGLEAARWTSLAMVGASVGITYRLAQHFSLRYAWLIPLAFWFQPWVLELSHSCLTEVPFLLFLVAGLYSLFMSRRPLVAGIFIGCLPLIRHEGIALVGAWASYAVLTRQWRLLGGLVGPYAAYAVAYFTLLHQWPFAIFGNTKPTGDLYGSGSWTHFLPPLLMKAGPILLPTLFALPRLPRLLRTSNGLLLVGTFALYLLLHVVLFRFGLFGTAGYISFLLPLAACIALAAVAGVDWLQEQLAQHSHLALPNGRRVAAELNVLCAGLLMGAIVLFAWGAARPFKIRPVQAACIEAADWMRSQQLDQSPIEATNLWIYYALERPLPIASIRGDAFAQLNDMHPGTIVVWDGQYAERWGRNLTTLQGDPARWRQLAAFGPKAEVVLFQRQ
jgi:hypothetical protein